MANSATDDAATFAGGTTCLAADSNFRSVIADNEDLSSLADIFSRHGFPIRIAGGAVRDLLAGQTPKDLDFATTATPDQMKAMFEAEGVRTINALGEKHGTVTARINDRENFEVTTLRIDVVCHGRKADIEFTEDWRGDANRRDLTVNSMFLGLDGVLYDFFEGREDLKKRRVAFVGKARERIQEDYLRILRYFRFFGRLGTDPNAHEADTIAAVTENAAGLDMITGERIWSELKKILDGRHAAEILTKMVECKLFPHMGLPEEPDVEELHAVHERWKSTGLPPPHCCTLLSSLLRTTDDVTNLVSRLKISTYERELALFVVGNKAVEMTPHPSKERPYQIMLVDMSRTAKPAVSREYVLELLKYRGDADTYRVIEAWEPPKFPVNGHDLMEAGCPKGRMMSAVTTKLREIWKDSDFLAGRESLLSELPRVLDEMDDVTVAASPKMSKKERKALANRAKLEKKLASPPRTQ